MNKQVKTGIAITAIILLAFVLIYGHRSARSPVPTTQPGIKKSTIDMQKDMPQYPGITEFTAIYIQNMTIIYCQCPITKIVVPIYQG